MKCILLAAGYATRMYPLTLNYPKPLLQVGDKNILEWMIADVERIGVVDEYIIVSNHKFAEQFKEWSEKMTTKHKITVIDDGSTANENRLGAVKDIYFAIQSCGIEDDILVLAGDNLLDFSLEGFVKFFGQKQATCVMCHRETEIAKLQKTGVAVIDENQRILDMEEKPQKPKSQWAIPPFYIYSKADIAYIAKAIEEKLCDTDAPGAFIAWFCKQCDVYAYEMPGKRYDIGSVESYETIKRTFPGVS